MAVLLPPDDDLAAAVRLCEVTDIVTDPGHLATAVVTGARVLVLGRARTTDLSRSEPKRVVELDGLDLPGARLPKWFRPNPGKASDLAFVFFSTTGGRATPLHHPSGLMVGLARQGQPSPALAAYQRAKSRRHVAPDRAVYKPARWTSCSFGAQDVPRIWMNSPLTQVVPMVEASGICWEGGYLTDSVPSPYA